MIGQIFIDDYPESVASWCNSNNAYITEIEPVDGHRRFQVVAVPEPTAEELAEQELQQKKADRAEAVSRIVVEVDGMVFDGDKAAQQNITEAIVSAREAFGDDEYKTYQTPWVLADNTVTTVTIGQLAQALILAKQILTPIWIKPYGQE